MRLVKILFIVAALFSLGACNNDDNKTPQEGDQKGELSECKDTKECKDGLACLPASLALSKSTCQSVPKLGCTRDSDCANEQGKPYCIKRRSSGKDISFCSAEKQCKDTSECDASAKELCLSKDINFNLGVCTKVTECSTTTVDTDCAQFKTTMNAKQVRCAPATTELPLNYSASHHICTVDDSSGKLGVGEHGCDQKGCQEGLYCFPFGSGICTLGCSSKGFTGECTAQMADYCGPSEVTGSDGKKGTHLVCRHQDPTTDGITFHNIGERCDNVKDFCDPVANLICVGTTDHPTEGTCQTLCEKNGTAVGSCGGGTTCKNFDIKRVTLATMRTRNWESTPPTSIKVCGN